jgi:GH24 family phage-related lysozyme (muramidase)
MIQAEGRRNDVYKDSQGILTVGIGHKVFPGDGLKLGDVIDDGRVERLFSQDGLRALASAQRQATSVGITDPAFIPHLASVDFQLGSGWTQKFRKSWQDIEAGD